MTTIVAQPFRAGIMWKVLSFREASALITICSIITRFCKGNRNVMFILILTYWNPN